jgi:hypothetical protein
LKNKYITLSAICLFVSLSMLLNIANATLIKNNDVITDTSTNMQWMTWTSTNGMSESFLTEKITNKDNNKYYGWKIASEFDLRNLVNNYFNITLNSSSQTPQTVNFNQVDNPKIESFIDLFGDTSVFYNEQILNNKIQDGHIGYSWGYAKNEDSSWASFFISDGQVNYKDYEGNNIISDSADSISLRNSVGGFVGTPAESIVLVRAVDVPEPSTLAIFVLGIIGLASLRFKKQ